MRRTQVSATALFIVLTLCAPARSPANDTVETPPAHPGTASAKASSLAEVRSERLRFLWHAPEAWPGAAVHLGLPVPAVAPEGLLRLEIEGVPVDADFFPMGTPGPGAYRWTLAVFPAPSLPLSDTPQELILRWDPREGEPPVATIDEVIVSPRGDGLVMSNDRLELHLNAGGIAGLRVGAPEERSAEFLPQSFGPALRWGEDSPWQPAVGLEYEVLRDGRRSALVRARSTWKRSAGELATLAVEQEFELVANSGEVSVHTRLIGLPSLTEPVTIESFSPLRGDFESNPMRELGVVTWPLGGDSVRGESLAVHQRHRGFWVERGGSVARRGRAAGLTVDWAAWKVADELDLAVIFPRLREDGPYHPGRETSLSIDDDGVRVSHFGPELTFPGESGERPRHTIAVDAETSRTEHWLLVVGDGPSDWEQRGRALRSSPWVSYGEGATEFGILPEEAPLGIYDDLIRKLTEPLVRDTFTRSTSSATRPEPMEAARLDWLAGSLARTGGATPLVEIGALEPLAARRVRREDQRTTRRFERAAHAALDRSRTWNLAELAGTAGLDGRPLDLEELLLSFRILGHPDFLDIAKRLAGQALESTSETPGADPIRLHPSGPWLAAHGGDPLLAWGSLPSLSMLAELTGDERQGSRCDALLRGLVLEELGRQRRAFEGGEMIDLDRWGAALAGALRVLDRRPDPECFAAVEDFATWVLNRATAGVDDVSEIGRAQWPEGGVGTVPRRLGPRWDSLTEAPPASVAEARSRWARDLAAAPWLGREPAMLEGAHWAEVYLHLFEGTGDITWFQAAQANLLPILDAPVLGRAQRKFQLDDDFRRLIPTLTRCAGMLERSGLPFLADARLPKDALPSHDSALPSAHVFLDRSGHLAGGIHRWRILRKRNFGPEATHYDGPIRLRIRTPRGRPERVLLDGHPAVFRWNPTTPSVEVELPSLTERTKPWSEVGGDPTQNHHIHELVVEP